MQMLDQQEAMEALVLELALAIAGVTAVQPNACH